MKRASSRKDIADWILENFYNLIEGDHVWAERRLMLLGLAIAAFFLMGRATEQIQTPDWLLPTLSQIPAQVSGAVNFLLSFVYFQTIRHLLPPLVAFGLAVLLASNYVRDLFDLPDLTTGRRYLLASMFGQDLPVINIKGGGYEVAEKGKPGVRQRIMADTNPIPKIGGPGYVAIAAGNAALFERVGGPSQVAGAGLHFIRRFESLREVVDLRDQFRTRDEVRALTKDGVPVKVRNVQVSFRARTGNRARTPDEIFPFSISAIKHIAYGKTVAAEGTSVWSDGVPESVTKIIRDTISRTVLDDLVAKPKGEERDPREKIKATFDHKDTRKGFAGMGVDLLWVSLGHIETPQDVIDQRIRTWQAGWQQQDRVTMAEGEAHKLRLMEYARSLARLDFIEQITAGLPLDVSDKPAIDEIFIQFAEALSSTGKRVSSGAGAGADAAKFLRQMSLLTAPDKPGDTVIQG
ncbi:MAG: SPFH domain-containing protein [Chloroflexota bacterium]